jgi:hypothetical protein
MAEATYWILLTVLRVVSPSNFASKITPTFLRPSFVLLTQRVSQPVVLLSSSVASSPFGGLSGESLYPVEFRNTALNL